MKITSVTPCEFHGLSAYRLSLADGSEAIVTLAGAHLVSWRTADGTEQLYLSPLSAMAQGKAIRGGVPVIFPQFSTRGTLTRHGFARTSVWQLQRSESHEHSASVHLSLQGEAGSHGGWNHVFACTLIVTLSQGRISVELRVTNRGADAMTFAAALHTYVRVSAAAQTRLLGLQDCWYEDALDSCQRKLDTHTELSPHGPVDRIYLQTPAALRLIDSNRTLKLESSGFADTVVWNPAREGNASISDLPPQAWNEFLCVEAATIGTPVQLLPGDSWAGKQQLGLF